MIRNLPLFLILFLALFGGIILSFGVPRYFSVISELLIYILLIIAIGLRAGKGIPIPHLWQFFLSFILFSLISIMINDIPAERSLFSIRFLFRYYFLYLAIIILQPKDDLIKITNLFIVCLLVLQFPIVLIKFIKYGINERTSGAYAVHDGSIATTLPISFLFYLSSFYIKYKSKISYIFIGIGYIVMSIVGAKRAVLFLYPIQFLAIYHYVYAKNRSAVPIINKLLVFFIGLFALIIVTVTILSYNKSLNPENVVGGEVDLNYALEYAKEYNTGVDGGGRTFGRIATTFRVIENLSESGLIHIFFGIGPGSTVTSFLDSKKERKRFKETYEDFRIVYGWTPMNRIAMEFGLFGVLFFTAMLLSLTSICIQYQRIENDPYWSAFATGSVFFSFSMLFFSFSYHWTTLWGDTMPVLYFYSMAVVYVRKKRITIKNDNLIDPFYKNRRITSG